MVQNYKKKTQVGTTYTSSDLQAALQDVRIGKPLIRASLDHGVSARTLRRHRDHKVKHPGIIKLGRHQNALPLNVEQELAAHVTQMSTFFHGLSSKEVRKLAYDLATEKNIANPSNSEKGMAGVDWLNGFLAGHKLSIRIPEATSVARMVGFNRTIGCDNWMLNNGGKRMTIHNVAGLFGSAFLATARASLAVSGFRSCGISPFNPDIFTDEDFLPSLPTEEEQPLVEDPNEFSGAEETLDFKSKVTADSIGIPVAPVAFDHTQASTSSAGQDLCAPSAHNNQLKTIFIIQKLSPLPKLATKRPRTRPSDPAKLLTSTPEKLATEAKEQARKKPVLKKRRFLSK